MTPRDPESSSSSSDNPPSGPLALAPVIRDELREQLAALAHEQWSGWMRYLFSKLSPLSDGPLRMPDEWAHRWARQMNTPYAELSEAEKESDRKEADRVLAALRVLVGAKTQADHIDAFREAAQHLSLQQQLQVIGDLALTPQLADFTTERVLGGAQTGDPVHETTQSQAVRGGNGADSDAVRGGGNPSRRRTETDARSTGALLPGESPETSPQEVAARAVPREPDPQECRLCNCGPRECLHPSNLRAAFQCRVEVAALAGRPVPPHQKEVNDDEDLKARVDPSDG